MKKIGLVILALVLVLGTMGVGYSMWFQTINVTGNVTTGSVCWQFYSCSMLDETSPADTGGVYFPLPASQTDYTTANGFVGGYHHLDKNVSWGECNIATDGQTLNVILHDTYPCNFNALSFYVANCGTVPIKVWKAEILDNLGNVVATYYLESQVGTHGIAVDLNGDGNADFEIRYGDNFGSQIEPNTQGSDEFSIWFHTLQAAPQGATLTFSIRLTCVQWNEYLPGPAGH